MDFSSTAQFFVATGVLCLLYTIAAEVWYIVFSTQYETNQFFPMLDLAVTGVFIIFWLAGASAWATNVSDIKHYAGPDYLIGQIDNCNKTVQNFTYICIPEKPGKWSSLYISLVSSSLCLILIIFIIDHVVVVFFVTLLHQIFGFANLFLWASSMWFVYKETAFHRATLQPQPSSTYPGISSQSNTTTTTTTIGGVGMMPQQQQQLSQPGQYGGGVGQYVGQTGYQCYI